MSQEIENNFEERKKDWDLTGLLDDVIRRYIYQLTNDELNEINLFLKGLLKQQLPQVV